MASAASKMQMVNEEGVTMQAKDIMTKNVIAIIPALNVRNAALLMRAKNISGLPVIGDDGEVCGILTEGDLMRRVGDNWVSSVNDAREHDGRHGLNTFVQIHSWSVGEAMNRNVISVPPDTDVGRIGTLMLAHRIKRVPVINDHRLVGIVSRRDLLNPIIDAPGQNIESEDDTIRLAVTARLATDLGFGNDQVEVTVKDRQVQVQGKLDSNIQRLAIRILVEGIQGVGGYIDQTTLLPSNVISFSTTSNGAR
ncbi:CBS domain-containing protein [Agrobacterium rhizogenes]|nr:CBS domain-containing protein [Rhizobium rhizogenes]NTG75962.1 CBS domain-containing protein [Rhizobium rhizogenes]NTG88721.1 CBS domain-containing protein [Rhizobium rhizogenes]NTH14574.1 CBS domain-containing protein [Rhizobium rhizogenes]NTI50796.1 CBS domain-containing protein [Rhizobium rhizogenes]NTI96168.1 CBS domain-containing protein [Rhizobium rhizogenes]